MKNKMTIFLLFCLFSKNTISGQGLFTGSLNFGVGDFRGFGSIAALGAIAGATILILPGNEVHAGFNFSDPTLVWDKTKDHDVKGGTGFSVEIRHDFGEGHKIIYGFQRNNYVKALSNGKQKALQYDYYNVGYIQELGKQNQHIWKPYLGGDFIYSDNTVSIALLMGSRLSFAKIFQLENRITIGTRNLNVQLGINIRYRKGRWRDIKSHG